MKQIIRFTAVLVLFLFVGLSIMSAQEATFGAGPSTTPATGAANGGFAWADMNADGNLDIWIPSNNILLNSLTTFAPSATMTANIVLNTNSVGGALADFNGDGVPDLMSTNGGTVSSGLYYNLGGVFSPASGTGDLASAPTFGQGNGQVFMGVGVGPIDHSNYLSIVYTPAKAAYSDGLVFKPGYGIVLLKGGASGFTNIGDNAQAANLGIDTSKSYEAWDPRFFDANNDGWMDLLVPSFRHGYQRTNGGADSAGARKGCVLFINDGTGKFVIPTAASLARTIYDVDSISYTGAFCIGHAVDDTGIVVDDTVHHFNAIGCQVGDLNNDGNMDMIFTGTSADNWDGMGGLKNTVVIYGKGDGTFTYHWNGVNTVANGLVNAGNTRAWSVGDYNNDGKPDLYINATFGSQFLFRNNGDGTFTDVTSLDAVSGGGQRAGGFVDYNNDGFPDLYAYTGGNSILQKNNGNSNKWIGFTPIGTGNNKMAIGARFTVWSGSTMQVRDIRASGGAAGGAETRALFGLGTGNVDSMSVRWPDGTIQKWTGAQLAAGDVTVEKKYWTIQYGASIPPAPVSIRPSWVAKHDTSLAATDTLNWNRVTGGTGAISYRVQVATNRTFTTIAKDVTGLTDSSTIVRLGLSTTYYWRVRAFSAGYTGAWSAADSFKTLYTPCTTVPLALYPAPNTITVPKVPILKVSYVPTASTYHIQIDSVNRFTTNLVINDSTSVLDTVYTSAKTLTPGKQYYWRVRGWNAAGSSNFSAVDSFTIMYTPAVPTLAFPAHNAANVSVPIAFKWNHVAGDSNFVIQVWTYTYSGLSMTSDTTSHDTTITKSGFLNRQKYYWKVMSFNQGGASAFSAPDSFTTVIEAPGSPNPLGPKSPTTSDMRATFTWSSVLNATSYHLQVAPPGSSSFAGALTEDIYTTNADTSYRIADTLLASTRYYWRISAINLGGESSFSSTAFFNTTTTVYVANQQSQIPKEFALMQNFPNPFNPSTNISYDIPKSAFVSLKVYDVLGRLVTTLVDGLQAASHYNVQWNASTLSSGVYFYRITARSQDGSSNFTSVKKLILMK